ncbi:hypothetical protein [Halomonas halocynthiae]|uniref:hypothetical protein n=1 Tax=Halomonas halocynthiae TaxID=176290 RepID=UPI0004141815|nr:hypothetical protein [Halomonas halocynthiae]
MNGEWLLSLDALDADDNPVTLRFSTGQYHGDGEAWTPRIQQAGLYKAGLFAGDLLNVSRSGYGETTLINSDGALDYLVDYAMDGRQAVLSYAEGEALTEVLVGTVARVSYQGRMISLRLRDPIETLQQSHPHTRYAGDNVLPDGLEGTDDDIGGTIKPRLYGQVRNAQPTLVNTAKLIYQISDQSCTVSAVYDNGVPLEFDGAYTSLAEMEGAAPAASRWDDWEPPAGKWRSINGYIRLGATPVGQITCDADCDAADAGSVMQAIAADAGAAIGDVSALNSAGQVRMWITNETTTAELLDQIAVSVGGYWRIDSHRVIQAGTLEAPAAPEMTLLDHQMIEISRESAGAGSNGLPVGRVLVECDPIEVTQTDLAGDVAEDRVARLALAVREAEAEDAPTLARHPLADGVMISSRLATRAQGAALGARVLGLLSPRRDSVSVIARVQDTGALAIGDTVRIVTPRLGYADGRNLLVVGREIDTARNRLTLDLWG